MRRPPPRRSRTCPTTRCSSCCRAATARPTAWAERAAEITKGHAAGYAQVEAIRAWIHEHIEYRYGVSNEHTDALGTLDDEAGVCRDFSHVGIALCRSLHIPARMVVGYLHRLEPMDLHAWFEAYVGNRWYTFDATQPEPRGGRIVMAYGRDAAGRGLHLETTARSRRSRCGCGSTRSRRPTERRRSSRSG